MLLLDIYDTVITARNEFQNTLRIKVDSNTDPTISDITSQLVHQNKVYFNGYYGIVVDLNMVEGENYTYLDLITEAEEND